MSGTLAEKLQSESDASGLRIVGHTDLGGHGDCMHVEVRDGLAYVGHMGGDRIGTSVVDVSDPTAPRVVTQLTSPPGTHTHKVQVAGDVLLVNHEQNFLEPDAPTWSAGLAVYDLADPERPERIAFHPTPGKGVHRMTYTSAPYAYVTGSDEGYDDQFLLILDLGDPRHPVEAGRWWVPGMREGETRTWPEHRRAALHHAVVRGDRAYATWWDLGMFVLDVSDPARPRPIGHLALDEAESGCTHTALPLPGRDVLVLVDEAMSPHGPHGRMNGISAASRNAPKLIRTVDISDETAPAVIATVPEPVGGFRARAGRFGPHNLHEMGPGTFQSSRYVHATYFNAGLRVYDLLDPARPREIAHLVPPPAPGAEAIQLNDLTVAPDGLIYATDRSGGGLYIVAPEIDLTD